jgi:hypothetical protein
MEERESLPREGDRDWSRDQDASFQDAVEGSGVSGPAIGNEGISSLRGGMKTWGVSRVILPVFLQSALDTTMARGACPETFSGLRVTD